MIFFGTAKKAARLLTVYFEWLNTKIIQTAKHQFCVPDALKVGLNLNSPHFLCM